jgi:hypothetical protein
VKGPSTMPAQRTVGGPKQNWFREGNKTFYRDGFTMKDEESQKEPTFRLLLGVAVQSSKQKVQ